MKKTVLAVCMVICFSSLFNGTSDADPYEVKGDINGDKRIDLREAVYALQVVAGVQIGEQGNKSEAEPNDSMGEANLIGIGYSNPVINATITSKDDIDYYKFTLTTVNITYVIETFNIQTNTSSEATALYLYDANGTELAEDFWGDNGTNNANARITYTFSTAGTYYVSVQDYNGWTGIYSLRILPKHDEPGAGWDLENDYEPNDVLSLANRIEVGLEKAQNHQITPNSAYVSNAPDRDFYHFNAEAGRTYVIETFNVQTNASGYATSVYLYDANSTELANDYYGSNGTNNANARITYTFSTAGTYYVSVQNFSGWTGRYSLRILPKHDEPGADWDPENDYEPNDVLSLANHIEVGSEKAQTHQITPNSAYVSNGPERDFYHFNAAAGRTYVIETFNVQTNASDDATGIYLYDANGTELADDYCGCNGTNNVNARITYTFSAAGTYYVLVRGYNNWTGTYSLRINIQ